MVDLKIKKLDDRAIIPKHYLKGDAALDITSIESKKLAPGERYAFPTGIATSFPEGYVLLYRDRSGLAAKKGLHILAGVIDSNYRGEHKVVVLNTGKEEIEINEGDRIVQALLIKLPEIDVKEVEDLDDTVRGDNGFGSGGN
ncbi:MAG: dUTP diphosphatase [Nanobdellota archaeon]